MAFKLIESAQHRWRKINAPHLVPLIREGVRFPDGQREALPAARKHASLLEEGAACQTRSTTLDNISSAAKSRAFTA
jgi:hypothetical protein